MTLGVNFVPHERRHASRRRRRLSAWVVACASLAALGLIAWTVEQTVRYAFARTADELETLAAQRSEVERRIAEAESRRAELLARLATVSTVERPQPWPKRLVDLTRLAPADVVLTSLNVSSVEASASREAGAARPAAGTAASKAGAGESPPQSLRIVGYAADHSALLRFVDALSLLDGAAGARLVRAQRDDARGHGAVSFEVLCSIEAVSP